MDWTKHIHTDPKIVDGKPVLRGTRLSVGFVIEQLAHGATEQELLENYPGLTSEKIHACLAYASELLDSELVLPVTSFHAPTGR